MKKAKIIGMGSYVPERILSNQDLEKMVDTSDEWIVSRTGIRERRIAEKAELTSDMANKASLKALKQANLGANEIDFILVATLTPDYVFPSTACILQEKLQAKKAGACDLQAACTGYLYALSLAKALVESGTYKNILVAASEKLSSIVDYTDRSTCVLFGDGAASSIVSLEGKGLFIEQVSLGSDGEQSDLLILPAGGVANPASEETVAKRMHYIKMAGNEVFKHAVRRMESSSKLCLEALDLQEEDISWLIPHQANERIIDAIAKRFHHLKGDRVFKTVGKYGNTSCSSIGLALDELIQKKKIQSKENILLTAFGSGFTWGAAVLQQE